MTSKAMMTEPVCVRCGACCYMRHNDKVVKCRFLVKLKNNRTACRVYRNRLGRWIGNIDGVNFVCKMREEVKHNFPNCPYNVPENKMIEMNCDPNNLITLCKKCHNKIHNSKKGLRW